VTATDTRPGTVVQHSALDIATALEMPPPTAEQAAVIEAGARPLLVVAGAALVFIGKGGLSGLKPSVLPQPPLTSSDDPTWARALVEETAEGMGAGEFRAAQGKACETCPVRSSCPVQPEGDAL